MIRLLLILSLLMFPSPDPAPTPRLVVIGDSIAVGVGASEPARAWAQIVARSLGRTLSTHAISGSRASEQPIPDVGPGDLVIWLVGYNDMRAGTPIGEYRATVAAGVARMQGATVIIASGLRMPDYATHAPLWSHGSDQAAADYARAVFDLALFVDLGGLLLTMPDGVHPDDAGHAAIAQAVLQPTLSAQITPRGVAVQWSAPEPVCPWLESGAVRLYAGGALPCRASGSALLGYVPDLPARVVLRTPEGAEVAGVEVRSGFRVVLVLVVKE